MARDGDEPQAAQTRGEHMAAQWGDPAKPNIKSPAADTSGANPGDALRSSENQERGEASGMASPAAGECLHCRQPLARSLVVRSSAAFCCNGCETVFRLIHAENLESYYSMMQSLGRSPATADHPLPDFSTAPPERLHDLFRGALPGRYACFVPSIVCASCSWVLERIVQSVPGVDEVSVDPVERVVRFRVQDTVPLSEPALDAEPGKARDQGGPAERALKDVLGRLAAHRYEPLPLSLAEGQSATRDRRRAHKRLMRVAVAGFCFGNVMLYSSAIYLGEYAGGLSDTYENVFRYLSGALTVPSLLYAGQPFWQGFLGDLRRRSAGLDTPVALALLIGSACSAASLFGSSGGHLYFDTITGLVFTVLVARFVNERILERAHEAAGSLSRLLPESSHWVKPGDRVLVRKGERVPADGVVTSEASVELNEAALTGEFAPVMKVHGDHVFAGAQNISDPFEMTVSCSAADSRLGKIQELLAVARSQKGRFSTLSARMVRYFIALQLLVAFVNAALRAITGWGEIIETTTAILVIGCPCALAFGVPLATALSLKRLWSEKVFARTESIFDAALQVTDVVLDKTGTLTRGVFAIQGAQFKVELDQATRQALWLASGQSMHPVARSLHLWLAQSGSSVQPVVSGVASRSESSHQETKRRKSADMQTCVVTEVSGAGLLARDDYSEKLRIGSERFCAQAPFLDAAEFLDWASAAPPHPDGQTPVFAVTRSGFVGRFSMSDEERPGVVAFLRWAHDRELRIHVLSGDTPESVAALGARLAEAASDGQMSEQGLFRTLKGAQTPEQKLYFVEHLKDQGAVVMMLGDGVNDAAALARADVGVAAHGGVDLAQSHSDLALHGPDLRALVSFFDRAAFCVRAQKRVLGVSLFYNVCALTLASAGYVHPVWAAFLMPVSSLSVLVAAGLRSSGGEPREKAGVAVWQPASRRRVPVVCSRFHIFGVWRALRKGLGIRERTI